MSSAKIFAMLWQIMLAAPTLVPQAIKIIDDAIHGPGGLGKIEEVVKDLETLLASATAAGV